MSYTPKKPKIYHIVHVDRLDSIISQGYLWSDAVVQSKELGGTTIGMSKIKERRKKKELRSHPSLTVGQCVPFYFCPRSVMLYVIEQCKEELPYQSEQEPEPIDPRKKELSYKGGQEPIIHLQADLNEAICWAEQNNKKWVLTTSNAGSEYFEEYCSQSDFGNIDWAAVNARYWRECKEQKQAEFLLEEQFPWLLVEKIGVYSQTQVDQVSAALEAIIDRPAVHIRRIWYY